MTEPAAPAPAPAVARKACDDCGALTPLPERHLESGLCNGCHLRAVKEFGVGDSQAGLAVLIRTSLGSYENCATLDGLGARDRVRALVLAAAGHIQAVTEAEQARAVALQQTYPFLAQALKRRQDEAKPDLLRGVDF